MEDPTGKSFILAQSLLQSNYVFESQSNCLPDPLLPSHVTPQNVIQGLPSTTVQIAAQVVLTAATDTPQTALSLMPQKFIFGSSTLNFTAILGTNQPVRDKAILQGPHS